MKRLSGVVCVLLLIVVKLQAQISPADVLIQFYKVYSASADYCWPGFRTNMTPTPIAYYSTDSTYILNPDSVISSRIPLSIRHYHNGLEILQVPRLDAREFHMETAYDNTDSSKIYFKRPVILCSEIEIVKRYVQDATSINKWNTMLMHEYFHGFQYSHKKFLRYGEDSLKLSGSKLQSFYDNYEWFRKLVDSENQLILECLGEDSGEKIYHKLGKFNFLREERRRMTRDSLQIEISADEDFQEKMEGSARYVEYQLMKWYSKHANDKSIYRGWNLKNNSWMIQSSSFRFFYSTGFNLLRLLDRLKIRYKDRFFDDNNLTPYGLIQAYVSAFKK